MCKVICNNSAKIEKNNETLLVYTKDAHLVTPYRGANVNKIAKTERLLNYEKLRLKVILLAPHPCVHKLC